MEDIGNPRGGAPRIAQLPTTRQRLQTLRGRPRSTGPGSSAPRVEDTLSPHHDTPRVVTPLDTPRGAQPLDTPRGTQPLGSNTRRDNIRARVRSHSPGSSPRMEDSTTPRYDTPRVVTPLDTPRGTQPLDTPRGTQPLGSNTRRDNIRARVRSHSPGSSPRMEDSTTPRYDTPRVVTPLDTPRGTQPLDTPRGTQPLGSNTRCDNIRARVRSHSPGSSPRMKDSTTPRYDTPRVVTPLDTPRGTQPLDTPRGTQPLGSNTRCDTTRARVRSHSPGSSPRMEDSTTPRYDTPRVVTPLDTPRGTQPLDTPRGTQPLGSNTRCDNIRARVRSHSPGSSPRMKDSTTPRYDTPRVVTPLDTPRGTQPLDTPRGTQPLGSNTRCDTTRARVRSHSPGSSPRMEDSTTPRYATPRTEQLRLRRPVTGTGTRRMEDSTAPCTGNPPPEHGPGTRERSGSTRTLSQSYSPGTSALGMEQPGSGRKQYEIVRERGQTQSPGSCSPRMAIARTRSPPLPRYVSSATGPALTVRSWTPPPNGVVRGPVLHAPQMVTPTTESL